MYLADLTPSEIFGEIFNDTGSLCTDMINGGLEIFTSVISSAGKVLSKIVTSSDYNEIWGIINLIVKLFELTASSIIVFAFLYKLFDESFDAKNNLDIWGFSKDVVKLSISVILIKNALNIVCAIFNAGSYVTSWILGNSAADTKKLMLDPTTAEFIEKSVSGIKGFFMLLISFIVLIAIVACAIQIAVCIYKRLYKLFILIPFASFSLSFFNMPDWKGREIFNTYLKNIVKIAIEAIIISIIIVFTYVLVDGEAMKSLFPSDNRDDGMVEIVIKNDDELSFAYVALHETKIVKAMRDNSAYNGINAANLSSGFLDSIGYAADLLPSGELEFFSHYAECVMDIDGTPVTGKTAFRNYISDNGSVMWQHIVNEDSHIDTEGSNAESGGSNTKSYVDYPVTLTIYNAGKFTDFLIIIIRILFPCMLAAATISETSSISSIIIGGF